MSTADDFRAVVALLRSWGFKVTEWSGCYGRSNGVGWAHGKPVGHVNHHYVCSMNPDQGYINGLVGNCANGSVINWFADVHGVAYLVGTGPMNHAGTGNESVLNRTRSDQPPTGPATAAGNMTGNAYYSGTECQHPGDYTPWPSPMLDVMVAINAAEFLVWGYTAQRAIDHYEWTSRKIDMTAGGGVRSGGWAGEELRRRVADRMSGGGPPDWFDDVTKDEMQQLLQPMNDAIADCQRRLRGADTKPGQRHEHFDMLQGIDADTLDTQTRVRGADPNVDTLQRLGMNDADILAAVQAQG